MFFFKTKPTPTIDTQRWVVVDTETSGLNAVRDDLLSIGAVVLKPNPNHGLDLMLGESFYTTVKPWQPSNTKTVLIHGIGVGEQALGDDLVKALADFASFAGDSPLFAYHAKFDREVFTHSCKRANLPRMDNLWLDIADVCAYAFRETSHRALDHWLDKLNIVSHARHNASIDAFNSAELMQICYQRLAPSQRNFTAIRQIAS